jgi:predicted TPR repeat methyltransferase
MRAFWKQAQRRHELVDLAPRIGMTKHRQAEGRLADEHVAGHDFERRAGGIARALVIARDDDALARVGHADLRGAQHMTGGMEAHVHAAETNRLAIGGELPRAAKILAIAQRHDGERLARGEDRAMAAARMIGMGVGDERARHRPHGVHVKIARRAVKAGGRGLKKVLRHGPNIGERAAKQRGLARSARSGQKRAMHSSGDILADRRFAWAQAAAAEGDHAAARDLLEQTLERAPDWAPALLALGDSLAALGEDEQAAQAWTRAAHADPGGVLGAQLRLAARGHGLAPARAPDDYVRALFDEYADRFDAHLVGALAYRGPQLLRATLERARAAQGAPLRFRRVMDLGCGTGLMAAALADCAEEILGADLSPRMVEAARRAGHYARVDVCDVAQALAAQEDGALDLVIAADVFVYLGDLAPVFEGAARVLARGGLFAFTVQEARDAQDWALGADLRYVHSAAYLRRLAQSHGLAELALTQASTRKDAGADVPGLVAAFARA